MILDHVNLNHIRIFECVFRTQSMTAASLELHLTQSGVSQHIKSLEDMLGVKLFDRIRQKLVPTAQAFALFEKCSSGLNLIEQGLFVIQGGDAQLSGTVSIGMPFEFGHNIVLPLIASFCRKHPRVRFRIQLDFASALNQELLRGTLDFAFVDDFRMDPRVRTEKVYDEVIELCIAEEALKRADAPFPSRPSRKHFESLEYVDYQPEEPVLRMWFAHHLDARNINLNVRATVLDAQSIARLVQSGVGAGCLPSHLFAKLQSEGVKLHRFKGCGKSLKNAISIAYLAERTHSSTSTAVLDFVKNALQT
jgi:DNA-binding transcriptional LysR family regulator